jgi:hypothetical protein
MSCANQHNQSEEDDAIVEGGAQRSDSEPPDDRLQLQQQQNAHIATENLYSIPLSAIRSREPGVEGTLSVSIRPLQISQATRASSVVASSSHQVLSLLRAAIHLCRDDDENDSYCFGAASRLHYVSTRDFSQSNMMDDFEPQ